MRLLETGITLSADLMPASILDAAILKGVKHSITAGEIRNCNEGDFKREYVDTSFEYYNEI